jgi:hypothetical protein
MSLSDWLEDTAEEFGNAVRVRFGYKLEKKDRRPTRAVKDAVTAFLASHPVPEVVAYEAMAIALVYRESTIKEVRTNFQKEFSACEETIAPERVFRWFIVFGSDLDLELADDANLRKAYCAYWIKEFDKILKLSTSMAFDRDSNDDGYYAYEAQWDLREELDD